MNELKEAEVRLISASARHERLCRAYDRGEHVEVELGLAHADWVRVRDEVKALSRAAS